MKLLAIIPLCLTMTLAARLDTTYLPPHSARTAGGSGSFLAAPVHSATSFHSGSSFGSISKTSNFGASSATSYLPPATGPVHTSYSGGGFGGPSSYSGAAGGYSSGQPHVKILRLDAQNEGDGRYNYQYETENQISAQETGEVRNVGGTEPAIAVHGSYSYVAPDGQHITVNYVADEHGFRPEGAHLPTPPPIPEEIRRSLEVNAAACGHGGCQDEGDYSSGGYSGSSGHSFGATSYSSGAQGGQYLAPAVKNQYLPPSSGGYRY